MAVFPLCDLVRKFRGFFTLLKSPLLRVLYGVSPLDRTFAIHATQTRPAVVGEEHDAAAPLCECVIFSRVKRDTSVI
ncbi:hypothetical protein ACIS_00919 [Anaplasma centrale str. Israel]|uniref:Uncharacterized protein n=1 Tax=Anaplasma centrale (strain Israel) TaxID=574556 RepID=D1ASI0_ANACI|nr:hypothetical protein ACIS_00919 [Anaplasma centrale str. Israel]